MLFKSDEKVYQAYVRFCSDNGYSPNQGDICDLTGLSRRTVNRCTSRLLDLGLLSLNGSGQRAYTPSFMVNLENLY